MLTFTHVRLFGCVQGVFNYIDSFWLTNITMTTVGYGDIYAITVIARIVTIAAAFVGVFVISLMVVVSHRMQELLLCT